MGLLDLVDIRFTSPQDTGITMGSRGVVALVLKDVADAVGHYEVNTPRQVSTKLSNVSEKNKQYVKLALKGALGIAPLGVHVFVTEAIESTELSTESAAFTEIGTGPYDYIAVPGASATEAKAIAEWVADVNKDGDHVKKVVLSGAAANDQHVINFMAEDIKTKDGDFTASEYAARVAGYIAALPPTQSITYKELPEVISVKPYSKKVLDEKAKSGELHLYNDGQAVRFASGVNSLSKAGTGQNESFGQIKETEIMDMLKNDIKRALLDKYIGRYSNSYENKLLLVTEIKSYLEAFERRGLLEPGESDVRIDFEAQKDYLREIGYKTRDGRKVDAMTPEEVYKGNTRKKVFLRMRVLVLGAIESITVVVEV